MKLKQLLLLAALIVGTCLLSFSLLGQIPTSGLVAYWPMDGNFNDAGPFGVNGSNNGATATTNKAGVANKAMNFSSPTSTVAQFAQHPINANLNFSGAQDFSYSFLMFLTSPWVHAGGLYENNMNYYGPGVWVWQSGGPTDYRIQFNYKNNSVGSSPIPVGVWKAICAVRTGGFLRIYIDGFLDNSVVEGTQVPTYGFTGKFGTMFFNGMTPSNYNGLNAKIDEFRIYNRALTATEIAQSAIILLPLKMGDFTALKKQTGIQLNWETLSEQNASHFDIERSNDGRNYSVVGRVNAVGNSTNKSLYNFLDANPAPGTNFYRLKMFDADGTAMYSRIIAVKNEDLLTLSLFPNPVKDVLQIQLPSTVKQTALLNITEASGRTVYTKNLELNQGQNAASIPVAQLPDGIYYLSVSDKDGRQVKQFIKQ